MIPHRGTKGTQLMPEGTHEQAYAYAEEIAKLMGCPVNVYALDENKFP